MTPIELLTIITVVGILCMTIVFVSFIVAAYKLDTLDKITTEKTKGE